MIKTMNFLELKIPPIALLLIAISGMGSAQLYLPIYKINSTLDLGRYLFLIRYYSITKYNITFRIDQNRVYQTFKTILH